MTSELTVRRTLPAPVDRVWRALTEPKALAAWFWPDRFETTVDVDLRAGGRYRIHGKPMAVSGEYVEVDPMTRLVFTWRWDGETHESLVTMTLPDKRSLSLIVTSAKPSAVSNPHLNFSERPNSR